MIMLLPDAICKKIWLDQYYYFITVATAGLLLISSGCVIAWPSPSIHQIKSGLTQIKDGDKDVTGIGYIFFIGCIPGFFLTWLFLTYAGRRAGMLAASLLYAISWLIMSTAKSLTWVYGARLIQGMAQTLSLVITPVYVVEISQVSLREVSGFSLQFFFNAGLLLQYSLGPYITYTSLIYINLLLALFFFFCFLLIAHETPYFLLMNNHIFKAETVLRHFRNHAKELNEQEIQNELTLIKKMLEQRERCSTWEQIKIFLFDQANRRALLITLGLTYLFVFSGLSQLLMFAETLFRMAQVNISPSISCISVGVVKLIGGFALPFLVKIFGIKKITVYSTLLSSIAMFFLGLFYFMKERGYSMDRFYWAPLFLLLLYFLLTAIGLSFIVMHVRAEIFTPHLKPTGILMQELVNIFCLELCSVFFTQLLNIVYIPLWFFSGSMLASVIFMIFSLPESKSMSLYDIQVWLNK